MKTRRELTEDEKADAQRLKRLWESKKEALHLSQVKAAKQLGFNSQGSISQYLNGNVPLNMQAIAKFAKLLKVGVKEISPRFVQYFPVGGDASQVEYRQPRMDVLDGVESATPVSWFGLSDEFLTSLGVPSSCVWFLRNDDESFPDIPKGAIMMVSSKYDLSDGTYLVLSNGKHVLRKIGVAKDGVTISGGKSKPITMPTESLSMIRFSGKVLAFIVSPR